MRLKVDSDCYNILDGMDRIVGKIVPRLEKDEIWYGVVEDFSGRPDILEPRGKWVIENTVYEFYNIDCETYV